MKLKNQGQLTRRRFLVSSTLTGGGVIAANLLSRSGLAQMSAPAVITSEKMRPTIPYGVASGDITGGSAIVWSRSDRPSRMIVEYDTSNSFRNLQRVIGPAALETNDYTARINLTGLPAGQLKNEYQMCHPRTTHPLHPLSNPLPPSHFPLQRNLSGSTAQNPNTFP